MDQPRPIYSFVANEPERTPIGGRRILKWIGGAGGVLLLVIVVSNIHQAPPPPTYRPAVTAPSPSPSAAPVSRPTYTLGRSDDAPVATIWDEPRPFPCPPNFKSAGGGGFGRCQAIDLPAKGSWIRRNVPEGTPYVVPAFFNIEARGCNGEIYVLAQGGHQFNASCGYTDFRSTDGQAKVLYEGIDPQQLSGTAAAGPGTPASVIAIQQAVYGMSGRVCDATARVAAICNNRQSCSLAPNNGFCGDPIYGVAKQLSIRYECSGRVQNASGAENEYITLRCQ